MNVFHCFTLLTDRLVTMVTDALFSSVEERERRRRSQAVQRDLPRPSGINATILKGAPHRDQKYRDLYEAEEQIKHEMLVMLRHDLIHHPPLSAQHGKGSNLASVRAELEKKPLQPISKEEIEEVTF